MFFTLQYLGLLSVWYWSLGYPGTSEATLKHLVIKSIMTTSMEKENSVLLCKIKHYLGRNNRANKTLGMILLRNRIKRIMTKCVFHYVKLTNQLSFKTNFQKVDQHTGCSIQKVNSCSPSAAYMSRWTGLALVQVMACRLFGAKPLPEPMLSYCHMDPLVTNLCEIRIKIQNLSFTKCTSKCRLRNGRHIVQGEMG